MSRARRWCFTLNNFTNLEHESIVAIQCPYKVIGREVGKEGTPHLQGYIEFSSALRFNAVKKLIPRAHLETAKKPQQAAEYCKKDGDYFEDGTPSWKRSGVRTDLCDIRRTVHEDGMRAIVGHASFQQCRVAQLYLTYCEPAREDKPFVRWYYGETGSGKSRQARVDFQDMDVYVKAEGNNWWPGYDAHEAVILDDFRDSWWPLTRMLSLLDRYECRVEFKGGYRQFRATHITITSDKHPEEMYKHADVKKQLLRRIDVIKCIDQHEAD